MKVRSVLLAAVGAAVVGLAALLAPAAHATPTPAPDTAPPAPPDPAVADGVPDEVARWFQTDGWEVLANQAASQLDLDPDERADTTLGLVRTVSTWAPGYVRGTDVEPPTVETEEWISPVSLDGEGVGVLRARVGQDGDVQLHSLVAAAGLAEALLDLAPAAPVVRDPVLDAWFTVVEQEVRPLDRAARDSLAGTLPVDVYQPFVADRYQTDDGASTDPTTGRTWVPAAWAAAVLVLVLAWAGVVVWLRREGHG